eukprot:178884_1
MSDNERMSVDTETVASNTSNSSSPNSNSKDDKNTKKKPNKRSRKRKLDEMEVDYEPNNTTSSIRSSSPPKKKRKKKRGWSDEQEALFREGLDTFGRDWKKVATHVGHDRNAASIRSHAQIYFLRLLQKGEALTGKLLETGNGYTLSGKPLNKYSAIALRHFGSADKVPMIDGVMSDSESAAKKKRPKSNNPKKQKKAKTKKKKRNKYCDMDSDEEYMALSTTNNHDTNTVKRRSGRKRTKVIPIEAPHVSNPFGLRTDIEIYDEDEKEQEEGDQSDTETRKKRKFTDNKIYAPYRVEYCPNALLVADMHAHLLRSVEIMGYLGGTYDIEKRVLFVKRCYPLKEEEQGEETVSANDLDILNVSEKIKEDNLQLVGWYHSHPCFDNVPSNMDCHQHSIHKYPNELKQPYVGLIIQSLWNRDSNHSHWRWFNTNSLHTNDCQYVAMEFEAQRKKLYALEDGELFEQIVRLVERYNGARYDIFRTNLGEDGIDERILQNLLWHLETEEGDDDGFIKRIRNLFIKKRDVWWVTNKPNMDVIETDKENTNCLN